VNRIGTALALALLAFAAGLGIARAGPREDACKAFQARQATLWNDLRKIEKATYEFGEVEKTRAEGYQLSYDDREMERHARLDFHIFMERYRNDTLEALAELDRICGGGAEDPLRAILGKAMEEVVEVNWSDRTFEEIVAQIEAGYNVRITVRGEWDSRVSMSLEGPYSLRSILDQIEEVFAMRLVAEGRDLVFLPLEG